jgi:cellulose synthase/poly-beta-1,6-N-acetylglucosamine synthase-like glycosyltransferase
MDVMMALNYAIAFFALFTVFFFVVLFLRYRKKVEAEPEAREGWTPSVSVIIPAYNEEEHIAGTLRSLLSLDYPRDKLEIMVVDDGSKDKTASIAGLFGKEGVRVFSKPNGGKGSALNYGIERAAGELIATMDADSWLMPGTLRELLRLFDDPEVMAVTPAVRVKPGGNLLQELQRIEYLMILFSRKLLSFIDCVPVTPGPFSIFRAEVFGKVGLFDEHNLVEDHEICMRIQANHLKVRSSLTGIVYTDSPKDIGTLLRQRVRWQRGGLRNYWKYRYMIDPKYGDFGVFFVPLNYIIITLFFLTLGLFLHGIFFAPYYAKYIWLDSIAMGLGFATVISIMVLLSSLLWLYLTVRAFEDEKIPLRNLFLFLVLYWYLMVGYNVLTAVKEIRREPDSW